MRSCTNWSTAVLLNDRTLLVASVEDGEGLPRSSVYCCSEEKTLRDVLTQKAGLPSRQDRCGGCQKDLLSRTELPSFLNPPLAVGKRRTDEVCRPDRGVVAAEAVSVPRDLCDHPDSRLQTPVLLVLSCGCLAVATVQLGQAPDTAATLIEVQWVRGPSTPPFSGTTGSADYSSSHDVPLPLTLLCTAFTEEPRGRAEGKRRALLRVAYGFPSRHSLVGYAELLLEKRESAGVRVVPHRVGVLAVQVQADGYISVGRTTRLLRLAWLPSCWDYNERHPLLAVLHHQTSVGVPADPPVTHFRIAALEERPRLRTRDREDPLDESLPLLHSTLFPTEESRKAVKEVHGCLVDGPWSVQCVTLAHPSFLFHADVSSLRAPSPSASRHQRAEWRCSAPHCLVGWFTRCAETPPTSTVPTRRHGSTAADGSVVEGLSFSVYTSDGLQAHCAIHGCIEDGVTLRSAVVASNSKVAEVGRVGALVWEGTTGHVVLVLQVTATADGCPLRFDVCVTQRLTWQSCDPAPLSVKLLCAAVQGNAADSATTTLWTSVVTAELPAMKETSSRPVLMECVTEHPFLPPTSLNRIEKVTVLRRCILPSDLEEETLYWKQQEVSTDVVPLCLAPRMWDWDVVASAVNGEEVIALTLCGQFVRWKAQAEGESSSVELLFALSSNSAVQQAAVDEIRSCTSSGVHMDVVPSHAAGIVEVSLILLVARRYAVLVDANDGQVHHALPLSPHVLHVKGLMCVVPQMGHSSVYLVHASGPSDKGTADAEVNGCPPNLLEEEVRLVEHLVLLRCSTVPFQLPAALVPFDPHSDATLSPLMALSVLDQFRLEYPAVQPSRGLLGSSDVVLGVELFVERCEAGERNRIPLYLALPLPVDSGLMYMCCEVRLPTLSAHLNGTTEVADTEVQDVAAASLCFSLDDEPVASFVEVNDKGGKDHSRDGVSAHYRCAPVAVRSEDTLDALLGRSALWRPMLRWSSLCLPEEANSTLHFSSDTIAVIVSPPTLKFVRHNAEEATLSLGVLTTWSAGLQDTSVQLSSLGVRSFLWVSSHSQVLLLAISERGRCLAVAGATSDSVDGPLESLWDLTLLGSGARRRLHVNTKEIFALLTFLASPSPDPFGCSVHVVPLDQSSSCCVVTDA